MPKPLEEGSTLSSEHEMESYRTQVAILNESLNVKRVRLLLSIVCSRVPSQVPMLSGTLVHRDHSLQQMQLSDTALDTTRVPSVLHPAKGGSRPPIHALENPPA